MAYPPLANDADPWAAHFAEIDALLERTSQVLSGEIPLPKSRSPLVYDPDQDDAEAGDLRLEVVQRTSHWPARLDLNLYPRLPWLELILAAAILRARGLTHHLLPRAAGFKQAKFRPQGREGALERLDGFCMVLDEVIMIGEKDLDRLLLADELMDRVTRTCRSNSKLPELVELFLSRP